MKIAIIGAGLAGLTAAYRLHQAGLSADIFEAQNRVGGRVYSTQMKNARGETTIVEWGGQNITDGGNSTHLSSLIQDFKLKTQQKKINFNSTIYYNDTYHDFNDCLQQSGITPSHLESLSKHVESIGQLIEAACHHHPALRTALLTRMTAYEGVNAYQQSIYHNIETLMCTIEGGLSKAHDEYQHEQNQILISGIVDGNSQLPQAIAHQLHNHLFLNHVLKKISWHDNQLQLTFTNNLIHYYDNVILAIPISTYKNIDLSASGIPSSTLMTFTKIGFGQNYKIALPYPLDNKNNWRSVMTENTVSFFNLDQTIALMYATQPLQNIPHYAKITAKCLQLAIGEDAHYPMYDWPNDPFALGSYAGYSTTVSTQLDEKISYHGTIYKKLFMPVENRLFFAGEHTTLLDYIGTMEGAVESGNRIAEAIIQANHLK